MNDNEIRTSIDDKDDFLITKTLIEYAENEGMDISNYSLIVIEESGRHKIKVDDAKREIRNILKYKDELFKDVNLKDITPEEYEKILNKYHNTVNIEISPDDEKTVKDKYPNINFNNLNTESTKLIISGDAIYPVIDKCFGEDGDYAPVILQWCRAVELELRNKIYYYLNNKDCKSELMEKSKKTSYYNYNINRNSNFKPLFVNDMMGFYDALGKFGLIDFVFEKYIKENYSNFKDTEFSNLVNYISVINKYRDNSAHSIVKIKLDKRTADECKNYIMASKKILEILSNLV